MKSQAEIKAIGYKDGQESVNNQVFELERERDAFYDLNGYQDTSEPEITSDAGCDGWDGMLINAIGDREIAELFGLTEEEALGEDGGRSEAFDQALAWYAEGAQEGADKAVEEFEAA